MLIFPGKKTRSTFLIKRPRERLNLINSNPVKIDAN